MASAAASEKSKQESPLPRRRRIAPRQRRDQPARQIDRRKRPDEARGHDHRQHDQDGERHIMQHHQIGTIEHRAYLHASGEEDKTFEQINHQVPEEDALQAGGGGNEQRPVPAHEQAGRNRRQHARAVELRRHQEGDVRRHQRHGDFDASIARPAAQPQAHPAHRNAPEDFANDNQREIAGGLRQREHAGAYRGNGEAVEDQRGRVIGEAFAFEHDHEAARQAETANNGKRRHRVRRCDNGPEHEAHRQRHVQHVVRDHRDRAGGEDDAAEGEQRDRAQIEAELAPAHGDAGGINQRRQDAEQHQLRRQFQPRQAGDERQHNAGNDEQD
jgi:hypothetical protein